MGILTRALTGSDAMETRDWVSEDNYWGGVMTEAGIRVDRETALTLSTVWRCVTLLTQAISTLPTDIVVQLGAQRFQQYQKPAWLLTPNPADPTQTAQDHFSAVTVSLLLDGNFFTAVFPSVFDPQVLEVLDPRSVDIRKVDGRPLYDIRDKTGTVVTTLDATQMLHGTWMRMPGMLRGLSPLEHARRSISVGIVAEEFGARYFGQGAALSFGVEVPGTLTADQRAALSEALKARYAGTKRSHAIGVLTGGAKFVTGLAPTPEQSMFIATQKFSVETVARWFGVPPHLVGSQEPGASSYASVEQKSLEFKEYSVFPLARRIEDPYQRLVTVPDALRSSTATAQFRFNLDAFARADLKTRYESYQTGIVSGVLKPNEARSLEDLPPVEGGDTTFMQMQMVPLNSANADARIADAGALIRAGFDPESVLAAMGLPPIKHTGLVPVTVTEPGQ